MARRHPNIYHGLLPSISALQITQPISFASNVPRSYHHPSDEYESQSRGGGSGGGRSLSPHSPNQGVQRGQNVSSSLDVSNVAIPQNEVPFVPRRDLHAHTTYHNVSGAMTRSYPQNERLVLPPDVVYSQPDYRSIQQSNNLNLATANVMDTQQLQSTYPHMPVEQRHTYSDTPPDQQIYPGDRIMPFTFPQQGHPTSTQLPTAPPAARPTPPPPRSHPASSSSSQASSYQGEHFSMENVVAMHPSAFEGANGASLPDPGEFLRLKLGLNPGDPINLWALPDPEPGQRPPHPYPLLVRLAIYGSPKQRLTLKQIYEALEERFEYYRNNPRGAWKGSIRHNLSLNQVFRNTHRPLTEPGKGNYWEIDHSKGEGYKRDRKRRNRSKKGSPDKTKADDEDEEEGWLNDDDEIDLAGVMGSPSFSYTHQDPNTPEPSTSTHHPRPSTSRAARRTSPYSVPSPSSAGHQPRIVPSSSPRSHASYPVMDPQSHPHHALPVYDAARQQQQQRHPHDTSSIYNQYPGHGAPAVSPDPSTMPHGFSTSPRPEYLSVGSIGQRHTPSLSPPESYFAQFEDTSSPDDSHGYGSSPGYEITEDTAYNPADPKGKRRRR